MMNTGTYSLLVVYGVATLIPYHSPAAAADDNNDNNNTEIKDNNYNSDII